MTATDHAANDVEFPKRNVSAGRRASVSDTSQLATEWPTRAFFGALLAVVAVSATLAGGVCFAALLAVIAFGAAREWHRMGGGTHYALETVFTGCAIAAGLAAVLVGRHGPWPASMLVAGSLLAAVVSARRGASVLWNAAGAIYIGAPALCLLALRVDATQGLSIVLGLFLTVWGADTGAFVWGRLIGGPKFVPALSPNKTWSGVAGGIALPAVLLAMCVAYRGGNGWDAGLLGACLATVGHMGDLFESWLKRRVGRKNSGSLIPGHGGILDRIDSTLFVAPAAAMLIFVCGLDPLFGAHP